MLSIKAELLCMYMYGILWFCFVESVKLLSIDNNWIFRLFILMCYLIVSFCFFLLLEQPGIHNKMIPWKTTQKQALVPQNSDYPILRTFLPPWNIVG